MNNVKRIKVRKIVKVNMKINKFTKSAGILICLLMSTSFFFVAPSQELTVPAWDFEDHTYEHYDLTTLTADQITYQLNKMNSVFEAHGLPPPEHLAYPLGSSNEAVVSEISSYRLTGRTTNGPEPDTNPVPWYSMNAISIESSTTYDHVKNWVDITISEKGLLNLFTHDVQDQPSSYGTTPVLLEQVLDYLVAKQTAGNLDVMTMHQAYDDGYTGNKAVIIVSFDDAYRTDYTTVWPMFSSRGLAGTSFIVGSSVDSGISSALTWAMINKMAQVPPPPWSLSISSNPSAGGSTNPGVGTHTVDQTHTFDNPFLVFAAPSAGYVFGGWLFDGTLSTGNPILLCAKSSTLTHILIANYVPVNVASSNVFQDGFESGSFSAWSADGSSSVVSLPVTSGSFAAQATGPNALWARDLDSNYDDLFFAGYVQVPSGLANGQNTMFISILDGSYSYEVSGGLDTDGSGSTHWVLSVNNNWFSSYAFSLQTNHWYFMQIEYNIGGTANLFVDGTLVCSASGQTLSAGARIIQGGNSFGGTPEGFVSFGDDYAVATGYVLTFTISASAGANGAISPSGVVSVYPGGSQSFTITPNANYHVADVLVDGVSVGAVTSYTFTGVASSHMIAASFAIDTFEITVTQSAHGSISPDTASYAAGSSQDEVVTPDIGYFIADITVDGSPIAVTSSSGQTVSFNNIQMAHTISATFAQNVYDASVILGTPAINGKIVDINGAATPGDKVTHIDWNWHDGTAVEQHYFPNSHTYASDGTYTVTVTAHYTGTSGTYTISTSVSVIVGTGIKSGGFTLTIDNTAGGGSVSYSSSLGNGIVSSGDFVDLYLAQGDPVWGIEATPNVGYHFGLWTVSGANVQIMNGYDQTSNPVAILVNSDGTISASFAIDTVQWSLTVASDHGSPDPAVGVNYYDDGSSVTASVPSPVTVGSLIWTCTGWTGTGSVPATGSSATVPFAISADSTITWLWSSAPVTYQITVTQSSGGAISPVTASYDAGTSLSETITPDSGYYIASITVDGTPEAVTSSSGQTVSFNDIQSGHSITATFAQSTANNFLVVRGETDNIFYRLYNSTSNFWGPWNLVPGGTIDSPAAVLDGDELYIVVRGQYNDQIWFSSVNVTDNTFSGWALLSGATPSAPTLISNGSTLCLVVRGETNAIFYRFYTIATQTWTDWTVVPYGGAIDSPAATLTGETLQIVVHGEYNDQIWYSNIHLTDNSFSGWALLSGATPSAPTLTSNSTTLCLVVRGETNVIFYRFYDIASQTWGDWIGVPNGGAIDSPGATLAGDSLQIVVRGENNDQIWHRTLDLPTNTWTDWTRLDGATPSKPTLTS
jgi:peptidoglycan/xylan/chitin deacetylase (PgdA/CDA1 family)